MRHGPPRALARGLAGLVLALGCRGGRGPAAQGAARRDTAAAAARAPVNIYARTGAGALAPRAARARPLVYVPNSGDGTVTVIDARTYRVLRTFPTGALPQHVVPSYDLATLWVANNLGNTLTPIDPATGRPGRSVAVDDPYNLYFTPNGRFAIVVAERRQRLDFRNARTMQLVQSVRVGCAGVDHMEFTADGRFAVATCEFSGQLVKVDLARRVVVGTLTLGRGPGTAMPQDIRSAPDGRTFYVADMKANGVHVVDPASGRIVATWPVPGGGSPDMGNVSADGRELWVSGRYDDEVYVFDTRTGALTHRIPVGREPHGLCVWPQPGRYSLGHTGNMR